MPKVPPPPLFEIKFPSTLVRMQELAAFPALTVMVFIRRNLGYRLISPLRIIGLAALLILIGRCMKPASKPELLELFAAALVLTGFIERRKRWREYCRGIGPHSYYLGDSCFEFRWLPGLLGRHRRIPRFIDPIACIIAGWLLYRVAPSLGLWLAFSGLSLRFFEEAIRQKALNRDLDLTDSLIQATGQAETAAWQSRRLPGRDNGPFQEGIPAGYAADIQKTILQRTNRPGHPDD